jgi:signal transduction histidine kinase
MVAGDEQLLATALSQLIDNALKYSRPDSAVTVAADLSGPEVRLTVHNFGAVIPAAEIERIFERFYRATDMAQRVSGTGLGLSITRKIAQAHGGRVWAVSDERRGTTFVLALPAGPGQEAGQNS